MGSCTCRFATRSSRGCSACRSKARASCVCSPGTPPTLEQNLLGSPKPTSLDRFFAVATV
eukprot:279788-Prymnesium_polylepis.2